MAVFMKLLNDVSRSQSIYRQAHVSATDLSAGQYAFCLAICREPGRTQEALARDLCLNKSTVARGVNRLEERGYVVRAPQAGDRRCLLVYPTDKLRAVIPEILQASAEWNALLSEGISDEDMAVFLSVLERMRERALTLRELSEADV